MLYQLNYSDAVLEFIKNRGRAYLKADSAEHALKATRDLFGHTRDEKVRLLKDGKYLVSFRVTLDYRLSVLHSVQRALRLLRTERRYNEGRFLDRYIVASIHSQTGKPEYLNGLDIKDEISSLRKACVIAREVPNVMSFIDWDICIHNYLELNSREGYKYRVVRKIRV